MGYNPSTLEVNKGKREREVPMNFIKKKKWQLEAKEDAKGKRIKYEGYLKLELSSCKVQQTT